MIQILKYRKQIRDILNHGKLREVIDNIENKKDRQHINFTTKHPTIWIYGKIGWMECQLIVDTGAKVLVCMKLMVNLLKLKLKVDKIITVIAIDEVKQKSLESVRVVTVKVID